MSICCQQVYPILSDKTAHHNGNKLVLVYIVCIFVLEAIYMVEQLSLMNSCLCKTLSYKENDLHVNLGFKCSIQKIVSTFNRNS